MRLRWMIRRDMDEVLAIERASFSVPWTEDDFKAVIRSHGCIGQVVEAEDERVVGFMVFELQARRIDLYDLAVDPQYRRRGAGRMMLERLRGKLNAQRRTSVVAVVSEWSLDAHLWFRACGARATGVVREAWPGIDGYTFVATAGGAWPAANRIGGFYAAGRPADGLGP